MYFDSFKGRVLRCPGFMVIFSQTRRELYVEELITFRRQYRHQENSQTKRP